MAISGRPQPASQALTPLFQLFNNNSRHTPGLRSTEVIYHPVLLSADWVSAEGFE